jgi:hypothetical protein
MDDYVSLVSDMEIQGMGKGQCVKGHFEEKVQS